MTLEPRHAERALERAKTLAFPRYPGTEGDVRAIGLLAGWMREADLEVHVEEFTYDVAPAFRALTAVLLATAAGVAAATFLGWRGESLLALGILAAAALLGMVLLVWAPGAERLYEREGPTRTANVFCRRPSRGEPRLTLVFLAHHDSKSQNLTFPMRMGATLGALLGAGGLAGALLGAAWAGRTPTIGRLVLAGGAVATLSLAVLSTLRSGNLSPGGVDNAGSVGIVLELAHLLPERIGDDVELIFLSPGAEEDHMVGAMRWLDAHLPELEGRPLYGFNFDGAGSPGRMVLLHRYGFGKAFAPRLTPVVRRAAADAGIRLRNVTMPPGMGIDSIPFAHRRVECLSISSGSLGRATFAIHSSGDRAEYLDLATMAEALELGVAAAAAAARELG